MTTATFVAIVWRVAAIVAVIGIIIGRMRRLRNGGRGTGGMKKRDGS